jgi:hypothetical protein
VHRLVLDQLAVDLVDGERRIGLDDDLGLVGCRTASLLAPLLALLGLGGDLVGRRRLARVIALARELLGRVRVAEREPRVGWRGLGGEARERGKGIGKGLRRDGRGQIDGAGRLDLVFALRLLGLLGRFLCRLLLCGELSESST